MKLTSLGKIALLLIALGLGVGALRFWQQSRNITITQTRVDESDSGDGDSSTKRGRVVDESGLAEAKPPQIGSQAVAANEIQLVSSASKRGWLNEQVERFNAQNSGVRVVPKFIETREAMQQILANRIQPALWSPSSIIWADRLSEVLEQKTGQSPLDTGDADSYRAVLRTPMVFLTTKERARFLRPLLSTPNCWSNIRALSTGQKTIPGGRFQWAHADPLAANSGMLTLGLIVADYAERTNQSAGIERIASSTKFLTYLKSLESRIVVNAAVKKGSSALVQSFVDDSSRYAFITAYESAALGAVAENPELAVIYPTPTVNAENSVAFLNWRDLNEEQRSGARAFLKFVAGAESARDGLKEFYRPTRGASLDATLNRFAENGFRRTYSAIELPPYGVLNSVAYVWRKEVAGQ